MNTNQVLQHNVNVPRAQLVALCQQYHIRRLALFGSVLRNEFRPESDVDVLVEFETGYTPGYGFIRLQREIGKLLGRRVDLNTPKSLSRYFRDTVLAEAEVLYAKE
jgi:predicted nucleotidyltransferase